MTTIAYCYNDGQVAIDSRTTSGDVIQSDKDIKFIKNNLGIWLFSGGTHDFKALSKLAHKESSEELDCCAMLIAESNVFGVSVDEGVCTYTKYNHNKAFGSGAHFALTSMDHGKSAKEAVKYASTRDVYTGGKIWVFNI